MKLSVLLTAFWVVFPIAFVAWGFVIALLFGWRKKGDKPRIRPSPAVRAPSRDRSEFAANVAMESKPRAKRPQS